MATHDIKTLCLLLLFLSAGPLWSADALPLVSSGDSWRFRLGESEASQPDATQWRQVAFDDGAWLSGGTPFRTEGFDGETLVDLSEVTSVYTRHTFSVASIQRFVALRFSVRADDGFIAWLNGYELVRTNMGAGEQAHNALASRSERLPQEWVLHEIDDARSILQEGQNVLSVHVFNRTRPSRSADLFLDVELAGVLDDQPPRIVERLPEAGRTLVRLDTVEVFFDEAVVGVTASGLLVNGAPAIRAEALTDRHYLFHVVPPVSGQVRVAWAEEQQIRDLAGLSFAGGDWEYVLDSTIDRSDVQITEFMASNDTFLNDEDGDRSDWIELRNHSEADIELGTWSLTDSRDEPNKWLFPKVILPAGDYLVVFASGKDRRERFGQLHTNFRLNSDGEYLALRTPDGVAVSEFSAPFPEHFPDISYGLVPGEEQAVGYFTEPSPGRVNRPGGPGFAAEVSFSRESQPFTGSLLLALSIAEVDAVIRYSTDGSLPGRSSPRYRAPLELTESTEVRARAFHPEKLPGPPSSRTYTCLSSGIDGFRSTLPIMVISRLGSTRISASRNSPVHFAVHEPQGGYAYLHSHPGFARRGGAKTRGSSTGGLPKASWAIEWWDEFDEDEDHAVLGMPAESEWVLYAPNRFDPIMIHNPFIHQLARDIGDYSPRTRFVEVFMHEGGELTEAEYEGVYVLEERISIGKDRVDIDKLRPENLLPPAVSGGYLLKIDRPDPGDSGFQGMGTRVLWIDPKERDVRTHRSQPEHPQKRYIEHYLNSFYSALTGPNPADPIRGYPAYIDVPQWIDFHIVEVLSGNVDSLVLSTYFHKPRNGKLLFGPHWDFDRALGSTDGRDANPASWTNGPFFTAPPFNQLVRQLEFWQAWVDRWQELREQELSMAHINQLVNELTDQVRPAVSREIQRWRTPMRGGTYETEIEHMKHWLERKINFIDGQMTQPPRVDQASGYLARGAEVRLSAEDGATIYFTTDGSDPISPQRDIVPQARRYREPIIVESNTTVIARARLNSKRQTAVRREVSTPWSRPVRRDYQTTISSLVISEVMFHPAEWVGVADGAAENLEYIELLNNGPSEISLEGLSFIRGVRFNFDEESSIRSLAAGERLVVAKNPEALRRAYPGLDRIAGEFEGALSDRRNRLLLVNEQGLAVIDFAYEDDWQPLADGTGFSLVLDNEDTPSSSLGRADRWRHSSQVGGSPGERDGPNWELPAVVISELQARRVPGASDRVELRNDESIAIDLSGWSLSDDPRVPIRYRFRHGLSIPPGAFFEISADDLELEPPFDLPDFGGELYLFVRSPLGDLVGLADHVTYAAGEEDSSFGRVTDSLGQEHFRPLAGITIGAPNEGPRSSPVVIRTISPLVRRLDGANNSSFELIEVQNLTEFPQLLSLLDAPEMTWRLRGAVSYDFPVGFELPPFGAATVVSFDPIREPARLDDFRSRYGVLDSVVIVGPWEGRLNNAGERITLEVPVVTGSQSESISYQVVDEVAFQIGSPWPDLDGLSDDVLVRRVTNGLGSDPSHWVAAPATLGQRDSDGDGLGDDWEEQVGLTGLEAGSAEDDADGDGLTNREELRTGTDPTDPESRLAVQIRIEENPVRFSTRRHPIVLTIQTVPGRRYSVYRSSDLAGGNWELLIDFQAAEGETQTEVRDGLNQRRRTEFFYRIQSP